MRFVIIGFGEVEGLMLLPWLPVREDLAISFARRVAANPTPLIATAKSALICWQVVVLCGIGGLEAMISRMVWMDLITTLLTTEDLTRSWFFSWTHVVW